MFPTPNCALFLGSGHWRPGICVLRRTSSGSGCPRIRCLRGSDFICIKKRHNSRRQHIEHVVTSQTLQAASRKRLATNHAHISWIHPIARWGILWRPKLCISDLQGSVHLYIPKTSLTSPQRTIMQVSTSSGQQGASLTQPLSTVSAKQVLLCTSQKAWKDEKVKEVVIFVRKLEKFERSQTLYNLIRSSSISFWNKNAASNRNCNLLTKITHQKSKRKNDDAKKTTKRKRHVNVKTWPPTPPWHRPRSPGRSASRRCGARSPRARAPAPDLEREETKSRKKNRDKRNLERNLRYKLFWHLRNPRFEMLQMLSISVT